MKPDITTYNPDAEYLRQLIKLAGITRKDAALELGISYSTLRKYLDPKDSNKAPYTVQYALEGLAGKSR